MSHDESPERSGQPESPRKEPRESWFDRFRVALGLKNPASIRAELADAIEETPDDSGREDDAFTSQEKRILRNLLAARDKRVQDVMVPRGSIIAIADDAHVGDMRELFMSAGHSRLPVYTETLDEPLGMIHIRDFFAQLETLDPETPIKDMGLVRPVLFAPSSMPALDLLVEMQSKHIHMALVIDEYGGTDGLVSIEDLLEIIVGEIEDEHDIVEDSEVVRLDGGAIEINAQAPIAEVAGLLGVDLAPPSEDHEIETIGGYVTALLGRVPAQGETVAPSGGLTFTILEGDARRVRRLRIVPTPIEEVGEEHAAG